MPTLYGKVKRKGSSTKIGANDGRSDGWQIGWMDAANVVRHFISMQPQGLATGSLVD